MVLQISDVPSGPSPIAALVSLLGVIVALLVLGFAGLWLWRRVAASVRFDRRED